MDSSPVLGYVKPHRQSQWGRIQSAGDPHQEPHFSKETAAHFSTQSQDLNRQIPTHKSIEPQFSPRSAYRAKPVYEWTVSDVSTWLRTILTPTFSLSDAGGDANDSSNGNDTMSSYIWSFSEAKVDGQYLMTKIRSEQDLIRTLDLDEDHGREETITLLFSSIQSLKQEAKRQFHALHPMKQSSAAPAIRDEFGVTSVPMTKSGGGTGNMDHRQNANDDQNNDPPSKCYLFMERIPNDRYHRIPFQLVVILLFCSIETIDFMVDKDVGGTLSMLLFMTAMAISILSLCQEFKSSGKGNYSDYLRMEHNEKLEALTQSHRNHGDGNDSDNEDFFEYDSDYKNVGRMSVSHRYSAMSQGDPETFAMEVNCGHFVVMTCGLIGCVAFVCSRWIQVRLGDSAHSVDQWIAVSGISMYLGGLALMTMMDLAFKRLLDSHRRRVYGYHVVNAVYYIFVVGHFAWQSGSWWLEVVALLTAVISMAVVISYAVHQWRINFGYDLVRMMVPIWMFVAHIVTTIALIAQNDFRFYPIADSPSIAGSFAFLLLTSMVAMFIVLDAITAHR